MGSQASIGGGLLAGGSQAVGGQAGGDARLAEVGGQAGGGGGCRPVESGRRLWGQRARLARGRVASPALGCQDSRHWGGCMEEGGWALNEPWHKGVHCGSWQLPLSHAACPRVGPPAFLPAPHPPTATPSTTTLALCGPYIDPTGSQSLAFVCLVLHCPCTPHPPLPVPRQKRYWPWS